MVGVLPFNPAIKYIKSTLPALAATPLQWNESGWVSFISKMSFMWFTRSFVLIHPSVLQQISKDTQKGRRAEERGQVTPRGRLQQMGTCLAREARLQHTVKRLPTPEEPSSSEL